MRDDHLEDDCSERGAGDPDAPVKLGEFIAVLTSKRRRFVLYALRDGDTVEFDELAEQVATWESETEEPGEQARTHVRIDLVHSHLPRLEEYGVVRVDHRDGRVSFRSLPDIGETILDHCAVVELPESAR